MLLAMDSSTETSMDTDSLSTARPLNDSDKETSLSQDTSLPPTPHTAPNDGDAEKLVSAPPLQDWTWVTGNSESLVYVGRIGVGATSAVHDVRNIHTGKVYARKVIHINDQVSIQDVMDEQKAVIRVCHSNPEGNVVQVFNHGWLHYNQYFFFDMERCDFSLHDYIEKSWPVDTAKKVPNFLNRDALGPIAKLSQVCNIMSDISNGVAWIHACGHIHRDLCPKNVLYSCVQKQWKIGDFGLSTDGATHLGPHTERGRGTGVYREPALVDGRAGMKIVVVSKYDIWAIGVLFYQLVHEELPFQGSRNEARDYVTSYHPEDPEVPFPLPIRLPAGLENEALLNSITRIIERTLDPRPAKRPSARELVKEFKAAFTNLLSDVSGVMSLDNGRTSIPTTVAPFGSLSFFENVDDIDLDPEVPVSGETPPGPSKSPLSFRGRDGKQSMIPGRALVKIPETALGEVPSDSPLKELEETLEIRKRVLGVTNAKTLKSMRTLADQYNKLGYLQNGIVMFKERVEAASQLYKPEDPRLVIIKNDLALAYSKVKDFVSAVKIAEEINEILPIAFSPEDTNYLTMRYNLAYFYEFVGELSKSAKIYEEVIRSYNQWKGRDTRTLTLALNGLESVYTRLGRYADAVRVCKQILEMQIQTLEGGEENGQALWTMKVIAQHYQSLHHTKDAIVMYNAIVQIRKRSRGPEHQTTLTALSDLAQAYIDDGQKEEAQEQLQEALAVMERVKGKEHTDTLDLRDTISLIKLGGNIPAQDPPADLDDAMKDLVDDLGTLNIGTFGTYF